MPALQQPGVDTDAKSTYSAYSAGPDKESDTDSEQEMAIMRRRDSVRSAAKVAALKAGRASRQNSVTSPQTQEGGASGSGASASGVVGFHLGPVSELLVYTFGSILIK